MPPRATQTRFVKGQPAVFKWRNPASKPTPRQQALLFVLLAGLVTAFIVLSMSHRTENNIQEFCAEKYHQARTAAESAAVDRYQVVPSGRGGPGRAGGIVCGGYRAGK